jgi:mRNA interferase MazF
MEVAIEETVAARREVYLVQLDPTRGSEIRKRRPRLIVSLDELNDHLRTVYHRTYDYRRTRVSMASPMSLPRSAWICSHGPASYGGY